MANKIRTVLAAGCAHGMLPSLALFKAQIALSPAQQSDCPHHTPSRASTAVQPILSNCMHDKTAASLCCAGSLCSKASICDLISLATHSYAKPGSTHPVLHPAACVAVAVCCRPARAV
jgi:hypothetical protein